MQYKIIYKSTAEGTRFLLWRKAEIIPYVHFSLILYCFVSLFTKEKKQRNCAFRPKAETELRYIWSRINYERILKKIYVKKAIYLPTYLPTYHHLPIIYTLPINHLLSICISMYPLTSYLCLSQWIFIFCV